MSESGWLQLATLLVGLASMWIGLHFKLKGVEDTAKLESDKIGKQNAAQELKIDNVVRSTEEVKHELNSQLSDWKREMREYSARAIEAGIQQGIAKGIELERNRKSGHEEEILAAAKVTAQDVIADAVEAAEKFKVKK